MAVAAVGGNELVRRPEDCQELSSEQGSQREMPDEDLQLAGVTAATYRKFQQAE